MPIRSLSRRAAGLALALVLAFTFTALAASAGWFDPPIVNGAGVIVLDPATGTVYYSKNPDKARCAASMTKLMSLYLIFDAIDAGQLDLSQTIPASARAALISNSAGYSGHEALKEGNEYPLEDLIRLVMTASCNGSMIAMAEYLAGDEAAFVQRMNDTAAAWGISARFADSCGLRDTGNAVTPRAMAEIARRILTDHPEILNYSTLKSTVFEGRTYNSTNTLLRNGTVAGIDGLKTGYTGGAKYCFTGTAQRNGTRMISVLMGTTSAAARMSESQTLLEYGFTRKDQLDRCAQADKDFTAVITPEKDTLIPYTKAKLTAVFSGLEAPRSVPCEVTWLLNGRAVEAEADRIWLENGASSTVTFRPRATAAANVTAQIRFPDGTLVEAKREVPVSTRELTLTSKVEADRTVLQSGESASFTASVFSDQGLDLSFAAGWYLDGKALEAGQRTDFQVSPGATDTLTLKAADLTPGTHTLAFRCNTGKLPQLEQESAEISFAVRDQSSPWARASIEEAIAAGLVPTGSQSGYTKAISRRQAAQMFVRLLEKSAGKDIASILKDKGVTTDQNAFTDTRDAAVLACSALGILNGMSPGTFSPNSTLTRAQAAAILNRSARVLGTDTAGYTHSFTDVKGHWSDAELGWPAHAGILEGVGGGRFSPDTQLTGEQTIAIVLRAWKVLAS